MPLLNSNIATVNIILKQVSNSCTTPAKTKKHYLIEMYLWKIASQELKVREKSLMFIK